jgi:hypothetical protein
MFLKWLAAPHVAIWWNEQLDLAGMEAKIGPRVDGAEPTHMFVIEHEGRPIGWIQWYLWHEYPEHARQLEAPPSSAGIDLAIGEVRMIGLELGPVAIREFTKHLVFTDPAIRAVVADPEETTSDRCVPFIRPASGRPRSSSSTASSRGGRYYGWTVRRADGFRIQQREEAVDTDISSDCGMNA